MNPVGDHFDLIFFGLLATSVVSSLARGIPLRRPPRHGPPPRSPRGEGTNWNAQPHVGGEGAGAATVSAVPRASPADLTPVDVAYVAGGPDHAAFLAYVCLVDRGLIEVPTITVGSRGTEVLPASADPSARFEVKMTGAAPGRLHPLEQAALRQLRLDPSAATLLPTLREAREMAALRDELMERRLVAAPPRFRRLWQFLTQVGPWLVATVVLGLLVGNLLISALLIGSVLVLTARRVFVDGPRPTEAGHVVLTHFRRSGAVRGPEGLAGRSRLNVLVVAAGGPAAVWQQAPAHATFVAYPPPKRRLGSLFEGVRPEDLFSSEHRDHR